jgi:hypothetical protein
MVGADEMKSFAFAFFLQVTRVAPASRHPVDEFEGKSVSR